MNSRNEAVATDAEGDAETPGAAPSRTLRQRCHPLVSILMPVRNEARFLPDALSSLFRQTLAAWELIVVDDGSTDATPAILAEAGRRDERVRIIRGNGSGLVHALNTGLAECRGGYVARMDGDDISHPRRLELQADFLGAHPDVGLVACNFRHIPRQRLKQGMLFYEAWQNGLSTHEAIMRDLFVESPFVHPTIMARRSLLTAMQGYHDRGWPEDYDLWLRMAAAGTRFARLPHALFYWRDHPERATRTMSEYAISSFRACKAHYLARGFLKGRDRVIIVGAGVEGRAWQRQLAALGLGVVRWIDVDPRKIGRHLHGAPICGVDSLMDLGYPLLVAIGVRNAREQFRLVAQQSGLSEGRDFVCVA